jgi:hypothetical protein
MSDLADVVQSLTARVAELEDRLAIAQLMASYGPAVDSGSARATADLWTHDGRYDAGVVAFESSAEIATMVTTDPHQRFITSGAAHVASPPVITIDGDHATATCYQQVLLHDEVSGGYRTWRVSAHRWEWRRTADGWKVTTRVARALDGGEDARALFRSAFDTP